MSGRRKRGADCVCQDGPALNLAHELLIFKHDEGHDMEKVNNKIMQLKERVSAFLEEDRQLEL